MRKLEVFGTPAPPKEEKIYLKLNRDFDGEVEVILVDENGNKIDEGIIATFRINDLNKIVVRLETYVNPKFVAVVGKDDHIVVEN